MRSLAILVGFVCSSLGLMGQPLPPGAPAVIITEILYDMPGVADSLEFIELTNPSDTNQRSLSGYSFTDGIEFTFPQGLIIEPSEVILVAKNADAMFNNFGVIAYQWLSGDLSDNGESLVLTNNFGQTADSVNYQTNLLWPDASNNGKSIEFCYDTLNNSGPEFWSSPTTSTGVMVDGIPIFATPGNSCTNHVGVDEMLFQTPKIFPNPSNGQFWIEGANIEWFLTVYEMNGNVLLKQTVIGSSTVLELNVHLPHGVYIATLENNVDRIAQRLVILE
jgi:hypothetical protein